MKNYLEEQFKRIGNDIKRRVDGVYDHRQFIMGPEVQELEERLADRSGKKHCITCASGTDAIRMSASLLHVDLKFPVLTFIATAEAIYRPVFKDVDKHTWCSTDGVSVELFGCPSYGILGDCAQSFGAQADGRSTLSNYAISCTSFFPSKPLGCFGDGGAIFTNDGDYADKLKSMREHGKGPSKYHNIRIGTNSRLDTIQAAVLLAKLEIFDDELNLRRHIAKTYNALLMGSNVTPQKVKPDESAWAQYCVLAKDSEHREKIRAQLFDLGYETPIYYPKPLHLQPAYKHLGYREGDFPAAEDICKRIFSLPFHPYIDLEDVEKVCDVIWQN